MPYNLLIDADDTLWENNIYFEQAVHAFIEFLQHSSLTTSEVRAVLDEVERTMGYGSANFARSLVETYRQLAEREISDDDVQWVSRLGTQIIDQPLRLLAGVEETLVYLAPRHTLCLLTKGNEDEQKLKLERSGLEDYFQQIMVVDEKNTQTYARIIEELNFDPQRTWIIGNSPKSDINPALAAGLHAIYIPHPDTWNAELQDIRAAGPGQLLTLQAFTELRTHF